MFIHAPAVIYSLLDKLAAGSPLDRLARCPVRSTKRFRPFFIIGSGRCGSTLLRRILNAHPNLVVPPETHVLGKMFLIYRINPFRSWFGHVEDVYGLFESHPSFESFGLQDLGDARAICLASPPSDRSLALILDSLYRCYAKSVSKDTARWGDKTPINAFCLNSLLSIFPDAQFIHIVRNGFDVIASRLESNLSPDLRHAAYRWKVPVQLCRALGERLAPDQFCELRYEDLVSKPWFETKRICTFLGVDLDPEMLSDSIATKLADVKRHEHLKRVNEPISTTSIGKSNQILTAGQRAQIAAIINETLKEIGY